MAIEMQLIPAGKCKGCSHFDPGEFKVPSHVQLGEGVRMKITCANDGLCEDIYRHLRTNQVEEAWISGIRKALNDEQ